MLIESVAGLVAVRRRMNALRFGDAMREPLFGGVAIGLAASSALSCEPQIDNLSHASALVSPPQHSSPIVPIRWRGVSWMSDCDQHSVDLMIWATQG
jgi:hypothetical protein